MVLTIALGIVLGVIILRLIPLMLSVVDSMFSFLIELAAIAGIALLAYALWLIPVEELGFNPIVVGTIYALLVYYAILFGTRIYKKKMAQKKKDEERQKQFEDEYGWMYSREADNYED